MLSILRADTLHLVYVTQYYAMLFGLPTDDMYGDWWNTVVHPADSDRTLNTFRTAVEDNRDFVEFQYRIKCAGGYRHAIDRAAALRDSTGRIVRWCGTTIDIEDMYLSQKAAKAASQKLAESEAYFRFIFQSNLVPMAFVSNTGAETDDELRNWYLVDANDAFLAFVGYSRQDVEKGALTSCKLTPPE
eukprot:TRINITY_DN2219_c0_g1_i1.p2 TRINITY_DN2219_c0_g1~~TRINITY_DN2219_c0_g1_i1.p2  ORF type:complete len:188 (-),score=65.19 TRINITY_DN2219_c0_g1_i1:18-581(-)